MADTPDIDNIRKQIDDLNKRIAALGGEFFKDVDKAIESFGGGIKGAQDALKILRKEMNGLDTDVNYFYESLKKVTKELRGQTNYNKDIASSYSKLSSIANKLKYDQDGISELSEKELETLYKKVGIQQTDLTQSFTQNQQAADASELQQKSLQSQYDYYAKIEKKNGGLSKIQQIRADNVLNALDKEQKSWDKIIASNAEVNGILNDQEFGIDKLLAVIQRRLKEEEKIRKTLGISGKIVDGIVGTLGKLGVSNKFFENLKGDMRDVAKTGTKWDVALTGAKGIVKGIGEALKDPIVQLEILIRLTKFFGKAALEANRQLVEIGKALGYQAYSFRENLASFSQLSSNINVTSKLLTEAFGQIAKATGFAYEYSVDQLETQVKLTKQVGLQADEAAQVQRYSILTGKTSEETYKSFVKGLVAARNQLRVGIDFKASLAEAVKISGQLAANLGYNPEQIAKAVVQTKALGLTFDELKSATSSLLDFGSSIENELKAELLTGKQLNLERARAAALAGDQVTLAEELSKNVGTAADFAKMNVLQQNALAASMGITSDQLSETLRKREEAVASGKSLQQINEEEAAQALERQSIQEKFNAAMLKLQDIVGNLIAGPFGILLNVLTDIFGLVTSILKPIGFFGEMINRLVGSAKGLGSVLKGILGVATLISAIINPLGTLGALAVGAAAIGTIGALTNNKFANGGRPPANQTSLVGEKGPELFVPDQSGTIISNDALNKNQNNISGPSVDLTPMIAAINEVRSAVNNLVNRPIYLSIDGKNIGTALVQGSHKVA